jgi:hypothetical protein
MSRAAKTIVAFGVYMALTGAILVAAPNVLLPLLGLAPTDDPWIRVLGWFMIVVSYYYFRTARSEAAEFFRATVHGRTAMALFLVFLGIWIAGAGVLVLFGAAELVGAVATALALRAGPTDSPSSSALHRAVR